MADELKKNKKTKKWLRFLGVFIVVTLVLSSFDSNPTLEEMPQADYGDVGTVGDFDITVIRSKTRDMVGNEFYAEKASSGASFIIVDFKYKNVSNTPVSVFSTPSVYLIDPNMAEYSADIVKTTAYKTATLKSNTNVNVNPNVTVDDAAVFEVSEELLRQKGWYILADGSKGFKVPLEFSNNAFEGETDRMEEIIHDALRY